ncbi:DUF6270 domain-containing protein [Sporolactobacillus shoreicorticis]|uniref:DUF6270 domain-containing protein n=1 Tax=Sporolactobacillus shoreicorticis TaxID=1923877 RepID=A0ABW5RYK9_9BACL|nr:DUF6270 domain-containing protein [Sporolactobacillus shoreicorticis]MCO7124768.1 DUF6270 domain-containing protein [Sporolactobacillus shoreicorticis]
MTTKIACYGSCATRDNFNSLMNPNYKEKYQCVVTSEHSSIISVVSSKIEFNMNDLDNLEKEYYRWLIKTDLEKTFLTDLFLEQPDVLILDFFPDVYFGVIYLNGRFMTNHVWHLPKTTFYKNMKERAVLTLANQSEQYIKLWAASFKKFMYLIREKLPNCKILVNKVRFVAKIIDQNNSISLDPNAETLMKYNQLWEFLDEYAIKNYGLEFIDVDYADVYIPTKHKLWNPWYLHYTDTYYHLFLQELNKIMFSNVNR